MQGVGVGLGVASRGAGDRGRPVIDRGLVLAMGSAGQIAAIDLRSGQRQWERGIGGSQTPWVAGRFVFVLAGSADITALMRDSGKVRWVTPLTQYESSSSRTPASQPAFSAATSGLLGTSPMPPRHRW